MQLPLVGQFGTDPSDWQPTALPAVCVPGLYIHVPFCFHKCHYCDFYSLARQEPARMERFVDLLLREAETWANATRGPTLRPITVFFGGGTPSLLPLATMQRLLGALRQAIDLSHVEEWTIECNPATVNREYCEMLRKMGVNRLSFGAQSFDATELATLERHHHPDDVARSLEQARMAGFARLNLDLIYAIPRQTISSWKHSLELALQLGTEHLSCYGLTYEQNTPITLRRQLGQIVPVEESLELSMLRHTRHALLEAGLTPYEISNYARPGAECRQNLLYWNGGDYIGLGPSAASHVQGWRWKNRSHLGEWESAAALGKMATSDTEHLTAKQRAGELVMLQLRLRKGVVFEDLLARFGIDASAHFAGTIESLRKLGLIEVNERGFRLTEAGVEVADAIAGEFIG